MARVHFVKHGSAYMECTYEGAPMQRDIRCPRCQGHAYFDEPFAFYQSRRGKPAAMFFDAEAPPPWSERVVDLPDDFVHSLNGGFVVERCPSILRWNGSGYSQGTGVVKCDSCHSVFAHTICWPDDAFYRWSIRGVTLWAWSRDHAEVLLQFLRSTDRDSLRYSRYQRSLQRLPRTVLLAKNRDLVIKEIARSLG